MIAPAEVQRTQQPSPAQRFTPPERPFDAEAASIPTAALGVLGAEMRDVLDRLGKRTKRDGFSRGNSAAIAVLTAFAEAIDREAGRRDDERFRAQMQAARAEAQS